MYNSIWFHFLSKISLQYVWKYFTKRNPTFTRVICYFFRFLRFNDKLFDKYKKVLLDFKKTTKESSSSSSGTDIIIITCVLGNLNLEVHKNQLKLFPSTILPLWRSEKNRRKELCFKNLQKCCTIFFLTFWLFWHISQIWQTSAYIIMRYESSDWDVSK